MSKEYIKYWWVIFFKKWKNKFHFSKCFEILPHISKTWKLHNLHPNIHYFMTNKTRVWKELRLRRKNKHRSAVSLVIQAKHRNHGNKGRQLRWCNQHKHLYYNHLYKRYMRPKKNHLKFSFSGQKFQNILWQADILFLKQLSFFLIWLIMEKMSHFPF